MASSAVWGIEIGQSALKALRCTKVGDEVVADAFDFIEYPKILSQPEADPEALVREAMEQLLERNDAFNEITCISVPGQSGLAKFFKPPPVEVKKIADIVRYEARQQIPFDLADVVWDYQMMPGSMVEDGYALESEVGLFAMKREQSYRQLAPFSEADIEVDSIQLAPIALYNMIAYDRFHERIENESFDADNPPSSTVLLSIGTDSSDLIITNGFRIWQRSMPIGGNHFTRQLTKDLKLTFAKAEHLKRNAREAADPKLIFQTMRPVFNDLVTEVQRSIGFFRSLDKKAEITELVITGNTIKLPGLATYLGKNLGFEVHVLDRFNRLSGDDVLSIPTFRDNASTFAVCYGLCLQGLGLSQIHASLVPQEILTQRMIRAKKPWTLAALSALLIGFAGHYAFTEYSWSTTHESQWSSASAQVSAMSQYHNDHTSQDEDLNSKLTYLNAMGKEVSGNAERRLMWLELTKAINQLIPREDYSKFDGKPPSHKEWPLNDRIDMHITEVETKHFEDLQEWWTGGDAERTRAIAYREEIVNLAELKGEEPPEGLAEDPGPQGAGWVIQMRGYHYYNGEDKVGLEGSSHVRRYLTDAFLNQPIELPQPNGETVTFTPQEMGFEYPVQLDERDPELTQIPNPEFNPEMAALGAEDATAAAADSGEDAEDESMIPEIEILRHDFTFQVVWKESLLSDRLEKKRLAEEEAQKKAEEEAAQQEAAANNDVAMNP